MTAAIILIAAAVDAITDGIRSKVHRVFTIVAGVIADVLVFYGISQTENGAWPYLAASAILCLTVGRMLQELWWHELPYHKALRVSKWKPWQQDWWHKVKMVRFYVPIAVLMWLAYGIGWEWVWLPLAGQVVWSVSLRIARGKFNNPWG